MGRKKIRKKKYTYRSKLSKSKKPRKSKYDDIVYNDVTQWRKQRDIVRHFQKKGFEVEGRFQRYVSDHMKSKSASFGYTHGLPDFEILEPRGKYQKLAIYMNHENKNKIIDHLAKQNYKILEFHPEFTTGAIKQLIYDKYFRLKLPRVKQQKRENLTFNLIKQMPSTKKKKKRVQNNNNKDEVYLPEKEFQNRVVVELNKIEGVGFVLVDGKVQGNISKKFSKFSKMMGYPRDVADVSVKNKSFDDKYKQVDMELKVGNKGPRPTQYAKLKNLQQRFDHFPCCVNTRDGVEAGVKKAVDIVRTYLTRPSKELEKYMLK